MKQCKHNVNVGITMQSDSTQADNANQGCQQGCLAPVCRGSGACHSLSPAGLLLPAAQIPEWAASTDKNNPAVQKGGN